MSNNNSATFKIVLPVSDTFFVSNEEGNQDGNYDTMVVAINRQIDDGVNGGVRAEIIRLVQTIIEKEGTKPNDVAVTIGKSVRTIERYLKLAKDLGIIEFRGAPKTGGYCITQ